MLLGLLILTLIFGILSAEGKINGVEKKRDAPTKTEAIQVSAPFPLGPRINKSAKGPNPDEAEIFVTDDNCGERRPFFVPGETLGVYTETVTETTFETHTTSRIINFGTTTTLTKSSTVTKTSILTSTFLDVSTTTATTTVNLSLSVFGGTITRTVVVDTTTVSTLYITPIAATSNSFVTRITRTTVTVSVTGTTVSKTLETVTSTSVDTLTVLQVNIVFASTSTLAVITQQPFLVTEFFTISALTTTSTPPGFTQFTYDSTFLTGYSTFVTYTISPIFGDTIITLTGDAFQTFVASVFTSTVTTPIPISSFFTFIDVTFSTLTIA